jgi:hypothetical protein
MWSKLKNSIVALAGLMILVGALAALLPLIGLGQAVPGPATPPPPAKPVPKYPFGRPGNYYLTKTKHNGSQALTACAAGYHMASIWEIHDPSALRYNTALGYKTDDSGLGPPIAPGWIRTGSASSPGDPDPNYIQPFGNCFAWTSTDASHFGKLVNLHIPFVQLRESVPPYFPQIPPWESSAATCNTNNRVWCMKD